jgi:hypothetical protein
MVEIIEILHEKEPSKRFESAAQVAELTIRIVLTVSTLATVDKLAIDGILRAKEVKVTIDGKPGKLADLKAGMSISMRVAKATEREAVIEIRKTGRCLRTHPSLRRFYLWPPILRQWPAACHTREAQKRRAEYGAA